MDPRILIAIIIVLAIILIVAIVVATRRQRSTHLRRQFGSEYDRALQKHGNAKAAEADLAQREEHVHKLTLRELPASERTAFADEWAAVQRRFVDDPAIAVSEADRLVERVMAARGYPVATDFEHRANDISVDYPGLVQNYRSARDITLRHRTGSATTEDLRQAMVYFRSLFEELLQSKSVVVDDTTILKRAS
ncbi:MAG TPA: hypothetical protein VHY48_12375 [Acidobacteriaceae bacterium]|nr:hypothetical protein [Acidobacteriaceae bacterium]